MSFIPGIVYSPDSGFTVPDEAKIAAVALVAGMLASRTRAPKVVQEGYGVIMFAGVVISAFLFGASIGQGIFPPASDKAKATTTPVQPVKETQS